MAGSGRRQRRRLGRTAMASSALGAVLGVALAFAAPPAAALEQSFGADPTSLGAISDGDGVTGPVFGSPRNVTFDVTGVTGSITGVTVSFQAQHTWVGDLEVVLIGPEGDEHLLFALTGSLAEDDFGFGTDLLAANTYTFTDSASTNWWTAASTDPIPGGLYRTVQSGGPGQVDPAPVTAMNPDFAGTPANGNWTLRFRDAFASETGSVTAATLTLHTAGAAQDPADFDGDGDSAPAVWRPSTGGWYAAGVPTAFFGVGSDIPVPADWDGNGTTDRGVFRPSTGGWHVDLPGFPTAFLGSPGDVPVPADWNGDGSIDRAVWRPATGAWFVDLPGFHVAYFGLSGDIAVPADWDGDGDTDRAIWRRSVGGWYTDLPATPAVFYGLNGDVPLPIPAASGPDLRGIWRPSTGAWFNGGPTPLTYWGLAGDVPVRADYQNDNSLAVAVFRPSTGAWHIAVGPSTTYLGLSTDVQLVLPHHLSRALLP